MGEHVGSRSIRATCPSYGDKFGYHGVAISCRLHDVCVFKGYCIVAKNDQLDAQKRRRRARNAEYIRSQSVKYYGRSKKDSAA